jgi:pimeloyl-ACP methyl ester carboxylesterase
MSTVLQRGWLNSGREEKSSVDPISYARNGDVQLAYQSSGPPDGEPLLLVMGLTFQMIWWPDGFCEELAVQGFTVARFDNRDTGLSTHFPSPSRSTARSLLGRRGRPAYGMEDMAGDVVAVMDALGWDSAHLLGESLGSALVQMVAIRHPDRVRSLVSAMGVGPGGPVSNLANLNLGTLLRLAGKRYPDTREGGVQRLIDTYMIMCSRGHPVDEKWVRATAEKSWDREHDPGGTQRQLAASRTAGALKAQLRHLQVPTLVIHGADDPWIRPRAARSLASTIPGARLITYPGVGHEFPQHMWATIASDVREAVRPRSGPAHGTRSGAERYADTVKEDARPA